MEQKGLLHADSKWTKQDAKDAKKEEDAQIYTNTHALIHTHTHKKNYTFLLKWKIED